MALDVYFKEDVLNVLRALHVSSEVPTALAVDLLQSHKSPAETHGTALPEPQTLSEEVLLAYQTGFRAALASVALAFGLVPVASGKHAKEMTDCVESDIRSLTEAILAK